ncbi:ArsA family ATPase [Patescibacteria group bacterium]|nr:ArsA family ATPase [Patescibacteria group bacterium]
MQLPSFLENEHLQLILFGGKGGSGKTTSAAATGIYLAKLNLERKILIVSTDPAHSLGDSFNCLIGNKVTPVSEMTNLWVLEMDANKLLQDYRKKNTPVIKKIASRGTYFDDEDIANLFDLSLPGMDEVMAVREIARILRTSQYDLIIMDTAPTGHTLRLLALPEQMEDWIKIMDMMMQKHRFLSKHYTGKYIKDECDRFLEKETRDIKQIKSLFKDHKRTEFVPVTIPEPMSIEETQRLLTILKRYQIFINNIIVNQITKSEECSFCRSRKKYQEDYIREIDEKFASYNLVKMPLFPYEIRGRQELIKYAKVLSGENHQNQLTQIIEFLPQILLPTKVKLKKDLQFILIGGKGGVGKTSVASATALCLARDNPDKKIMVFSTDPAHGLGDSFDCSIGDKVTSIKAMGNLYAFELNPKRLLENLKDEYKKDIEEVFDKFLTTGVDVKFDREVMTELINISPSGLDEIMALKKIIDFAETKEFDLYVIDSAATGHLIRFLELPGLVRDWLKAIFRLFLKYKGMASFTKPAEKMVDFSKSIRIVREALTDSKRTEFLTVTIPEAMGVVEMERLISSLGKLKIPCHNILVNMVVPPVECSFCLLKRKGQQKYIQGVCEKFPKHHITTVPLFSHKTKGIDGLLELSKILYGN